MTSRRSDATCVRVSSGASVLGIAIASAIALLAGCASQNAPSPVVRDAAIPGQVLGRSERFVIYEPGDDDTLASIAIRFLGGADRNWLIADFNEVTRAERGRPLVIPLKPVDAVAVRANEYQTVPILCYHRFGGGKGKMFVSPAQFDAQLDWLANNDYRVIPLRQLVGYLEGRANIPRRAVVITIDDGHESAYQYAVPLLKKHGFPATFYVYTDFVGAGSAMTWAQLQEVASTDAFEIAAHSKTHRNLNVREPGESDVAYRKNMEAEVRVPLEVLGKHLNVPVTTYAYPNGESNDLVVGLLGKSNVQLASTVTPGSNPFFAQPLMLHRTMIFGSYDLEAFKTKLQVTRKLGE